MRLHLGATTRGDPGTTYLGSNLTIGLPGEPSIWWKYQELGQQNFISELVYKLMLRVGLVNYDINVKASLIDD